MRKAPLVLAAGLLATATVAGAQEHHSPPPPQIMTSGTGEVRVTPDRATISIGVQSRAATAAQASALNAQKQRAVIDAIKAKGVPANRIQTSNFNVVPETRYDREGQAAPRTLSYLVMNTVMVDLQRIDLVGPVIDAALGAGANQINSLNFGIQASDSARREALTQAVGKARADAEVMARAAGGSLGALIEMTASEAFVPPPRPYAMMAMEAKAADTPIEAGQETVRATVSARWRFVSGQSQR